jgi:hypothetical protein
MVVAACGDGGGGDASPPPPPPTAAPTIPTPPAATATADDAGSATFSVAASGDALRYQWRRNGTDVAGATAASYTLNPVTLADNGSRWSVVVSNAGGSVTSSETVLTVRAVAPRITTAPASATVTAGQAASFGVVAAGSAPLAYQWLRGGQPIAGATSASYTTPATALADNGAAFSVQVSNAAGSVTSAAAVLIVNAALVAPTITAQPQAATVTAGQTATFSITATGSAPLAYQWRRNGTAIAGATAASYTTPVTTSADNGAAFTVVVSNAAGSVSSAAAVLTVNAPSAVQAQARLAFGTGHVVAIRADGSVIAWGSNAAGQLGNGPAIAGSNARVVAATATAVAAGNFESLALGGDGIVRGWGRKFGNTSIIGGDAANTGTDVPSPVASALPGGVTQLVTGTGNSFAFVLRNDGTVWHMPGLATAISGGFNQAARQVGGLPAIASIWPGRSAEPIAIGQDGSVWRIQVLGSAPAASWQASVQAITGLGNVAAAVCNGVSCLALRGDGSLHAFQGSGSSTPVTGLPAVTRIATTGSQFIALSADGRVWRLNGATPEQVPGLTNVVAIAGGLQTALVLRADGTVWGWGQNNFGELGAGVPSSPSTPVQVPGINLN